MSPVERCFKGNGLPWNTKIELKLSDVGIDAVEHTKELELEEWIWCFDGVSTIQKQVAKRAFNMLTAEGECDPKKCAVQMGLFQTSTAPTWPISTAGKGKIKDDGTTFSLETMWKGKEGFTVTKIDSKKRPLEP